MSTKPVGRVGRRRNPPQQCRFALRYPVLLALAALTVLAALDLLFPPDLSRAQMLSTVVTDEKGRILHPFLSADDRWRLPADPAMVDARYLALLKTYEDKRFGHHPGVDPLAALRAAAQLASSGRIVSGASTLTMQSARLLDPGPTRGLGAKIGQSLRALQLERRLSKDEILQIYLTLAPFGGNLEGVRAAALAYFGKEPRHLTLAEAALLVALPQSPERLRPDRHPEAARAGRDKVLRLLAERGTITLTERDEALDDPVPTARRAMPRRAPHLSMALASRSPRGGVIRTEIDGVLQAALEGLARREQAALDDGRGRVNLALIVLENDGRAVRAYIGNADPNGRSGYVDLARAVRSPGSTLKPFVYAVAFDDLAAHPMTLMEDRPTLFGDYAPRNFDRGYQGTVSLADALRYSLNVPAVALLDRIGPARFSAKLAHAGIGLRYPRTAGGPSLPLVLGGVGTRLTDLVTLYASLAEDGIVRPLNMRHDRPVHQRAVPLIGPVAAFYVRDALLDSPLPEGWGEGRGLTRRPIAFKTGTSYGFRDAWSIGVSERYTVGVWVGRPDGSTRPGSIGRDTAAPILLSVFDLLPPESRARPSAPKGAIMAASSEALPRALRRFTVDRAAGSGLRAPAQPLEIAFPPNGATVVLPDEGRDLALRAEGGRGALFWVINGAPLDRARAQGRRAYWTPDGPGYSRVTVIDADGKSASSIVKLVEAP